MYPMALYNIPNGPSYTLITIALYNKLNSRIQLAQYISFCKEGNFWLQNLDDLLLGHCCLLTDDVDTIKISFDKFKAREQVQRTRLVALSESRHVFFQGSA